MSTSNVRNCFIAGSIRFLFSCLPALIRIFFRLFRPSNFKLKASISSETPSFIGLTPFVPPPLSVAGPSAFGAHAPRLAVPYPQMVRMLKCESSIVNAEIVHRPVYHLTNALVDRYQQARGVHPIFILCTHCLLCQAQRLPPLAVSALTLQLVLTIKTVK